MADENNSVIAGESVDVGTIKGESPQKNPIDAQQ
jgi:hypothetical protein